jgi:hypothetical protein
MKSHYTPGPWNPHRSVSGFVIVYSDGENRSHVARLFDSALCEEHGSIEANAHLISAAPDLLSALERLTHPMADDEDLDYARSIIAKAKGLE